jgi:hypothetical protein
VRVYNTQPRCNYYAAQFDCFGPGGEHGDAFRNGTCGDYRGLPKKSRALKAQAYLRAPLFESFVVEETKGSDPPMRSLRKANLGAFGNTALRCAPSAARPGHGVAFHSRRAASVYAQEDSYSSKRTLGIGVVTGFCIGLT